MQTQDKVTRKAGWVAGGRSGGRRQRCSGGRRHRQWHSGGRHCRKWPSDGAWTRTGNGARTGYSSKVGFLVGPGSLATKTQNEPPIG